MAESPGTDRIIRWVIVIIGLAGSVAFAVATLGVTAATVKMSVIAVGFFVVWLTTKVGRRRHTDDEDFEPVKEVSE